MTIMKELCKDLVQSRPGIANSMFKDRNMLAGLRKEKRVNVAITWFMRRAVGDKVRKVYRNKAMEGLVGPLMTLCFIVRSMENHSMVIWMRIL